MHLHSEMSRRIADLGFLYSRRYGIRLNLGNPIFSFSKWIPRTRPASLCSCPLFYWNVEPGKFYIMCRNVNMAAARTYTDEVIWTGSRRTPSMNGLFVEWLFIPRITTTFLKHVGVVVGGVRDAVFLHSAQHHGSTMGWPWSLTPSKFFED